MNADDLYQFHSSYPLWQIETVTGALEQANVDYQVAFDDAGIKKMDPVTASFGGTYGDGAKANLFVLQGEVEKANEILREFIPEGVETEHQSVPLFRSFFGSSPLDCS